MVQPAGSSRIGDGSTITGTLYRESVLGSGLQGTPGVGTPASSSQVTGGTSSGSSSDEERPVCEQSSWKKKPKWLRETLKEALKVGTWDSVRTINIPDRLGMLLVAGIILGENFIPVGYFPCFSPKKILHFAFFEALFHPILMG